ncbi:MAG: DUF1778 domain-containing protein [Magnetococcus sp. YQC-9]
METQTNQPGRDSLNLRIRPEEKWLIDQAARSRGQNRTEFILQAARREAEETLLEQRLIRVDEEAHAQWLALLDAPPQPNERLCRSLRTPTPWE